MNAQPVDNSHYVKLIMALTCTFNKKLSTGLTRMLRSGALLRAARRGSSKRRTRAIGTGLCLAAFIPQTVQLNAATHQTSDHYKLYLHSKIVNYNQFQCAVEVAHRESRWNWRAVNGNHYGLFQMNNSKVQYMNPYTQIDWWLRYVHKRYNNQPCLSLKHLKSKGWQ